MAHLLVNACYRDLESFVGRSHLPAVEAALALNSQNIQDRVDMLLERAKQRVARFRAGEMRGPELRDWVRPTDLSATRSEEHTSELQSLMRISYAVFCLKKKKYN